jgi:hypothetical protein
MAHSLFTLDPDSRIGSSSEHQDGKTSNQDLRRIGSDSTIRAPTHGVKVTSSAAAAVQNGKEATG